MKKCILLVFILVISYLIFQQDFTFKLSHDIENQPISTLNQIPITCQDCDLKQTILTQYQNESYPIPAYILPFLNQFIMVPQSSLDELFSPLTSGYTKTYFENDQYISHEIFISDTLFRKTTLLHEALHVIDAILQISTSDDFIDLMNQEMNTSYNERIYEYYESDAFASEYFVESYINYLEDPVFFEVLQPKTFRFIKEIESFLIE